MRLPPPMICVPLLCACSGPVMGTDAAAVMDSAAPAEDAALAIDSANGVDAPPTGCGYPGGPVEPMALDEVIWPYRWPEAIVLADDRNVPLDLVDAHCTADENIDWSPFDVLVFIAIPAW